MTTDSTARKAIDRAAATWVVRLGSPVLDDEDRRAFRAWLDADPAHREAFEAAHSVWDDLEVPAEQLATSERRRSWRGMWLAATAVVLAIAGAAFGPTRADYATGSAEREIVTLADGSRITLGSHSAVDVHMDSAGRRVALRHGRVFFEVAPDPTRPFVVAAGDVETAVLGTAFAVDRSGDTVAVVVEHGKVAVRDGAGGAIELAAGERVSASDALGDPQPARLDHALAWRRGLLVFEDMTLAEIATEIGRTSGEHIVIPQATVRDLRLSGVFRESDPIAIIDTIRDGLDLRSVDLGPATVIFR